MIERLAVCIATAGFVGRVPLVPGTAGSAAGLGLYALLHQIDGPRLEGIAIVMILVLGIWSAGTAERLLGTKDPGPVVIDEVLGMLISLAFLEVTLAGALVGFVLFRIFDVVKPYPARRLERLPGGFGVMLDDAMAALYAHGAMRLLVALLPGRLA